MSVVEHLATIDTRLNALEARTAPPGPSLKDLQERLEEVERLLYGDRRAVR